MELMGIYYAGVVSATSVMATEFCDSKGIYSDGPEQCFECDYNSNRGYQWL